MLQNHNRLQCRGGWSHFFRLRLHSYFEILESGSGSENFSNLRIRLLFRLRLPSIQPKFTQVLLKKWPRRLLLLPTLTSDSGSESDFSQIFDSGPVLGLKKSQNPAGVDSGTLDTWPPLLQCRQSRKHFNPEKTLQLKIFCLSIYKTIYRHVIHKQISLWLWALKPIDESNPKNLFNCPWSSLAISIRETVLCAEIVCEKICVMKHLWK